MRRAISTFIREEGISTMLCRAVLPLRTRVSMSAMGSVIDMVLASSPARLGQTGDDALVRDFAQADAADPELAVVRTRAAAPGATVVLARLVAPVSYTHLRAHETRHDLVCRLLLEKKKKKNAKKNN